MNNSNLIAIAAIGGLAYYWYNNGKMGQMRKNKLDEQGYMNVNPHFNKQKLRLKKEASSTSSSSQTYKLTPEEKAAMNGAFGNVNDILTKYKNATNVY